VSYKTKIVVALWVIVVAVGVSLVLAPWHWWSGNKSTAGSPVSQYIKSVDSVEKQMHQQLTQMLNAYRNFSTQNNNPKALAKLAKPEQTLRTLGQRLSALPAPPEALKLRRLLEQFISDEDAIAVEIQELASFMPHFRGLTGVANVAKTQLAKALVAAAPPKAHSVRGTPKQIAAARAAYAAAARRAQAAQADAIDVYDGVLAVTAHGLRTLRPPPVIAPAYSAELRTLEATEKAGAALSLELRKPNNHNVPALSRRFTVASRISGSVGAQRAEIAAVKAYNARVSAIRTLESRIRVELARLQRLPG
jgi:hypothetical protein